MSRVQLEQLNIDGLREIARQNNLDIRNTRSMILDRINEHFEKEGWPDQIVLSAPNLDGEGLIQEETTIIGGPQAGSSGIHASLAQGPAAERNQISVQEITRAVLQVLESRNGRSPSTSGAPRAPSEPTNDGLSSSPFHNWNQVKFTEINSRFFGQGR